MTGTHPERKAARIIAAYAQKEQKARQGTPPSELIEVCVLVAAMAKVNEKQEVQEVEYGSFSFAEQVDGTVGFVYEADTPQFVKDRRIKQAQEWATSLRNEKKVTHD